MLRQALVRAAEKASGRKFTRWVLGGTMACIGAAVSIAFFRWAFGAAFPPIPGEAIFAAGIPALAQIADNAIRSWQHSRLGTPSGAL